MVNNLFIYKKYTQTYININIIIIIIIIETFLSLHTNIYIYVYVCLNSLSSNPTWETHSNLHMDVIPKLPDVNLQVDKGL